MTENTCDTAPPTSLHDMGGNIGPASMHESADEETGSDYAEDIDSSMVGEASQNTVVEGSDRGGNSNTPPVAGARSEYISIDETDSTTDTNNVGRGGEGETEARIAQKHAGGPEV